MTLSRLLSPLPPTLSRFLSTAVQTESRWRRLKRERRQAPPPRDRQPPSFDRTLSHTLPAAIGHARLSSWAGFDETLELVLRLNLDPRRAEQNIRGHVTLPHGTGRKIKVAAITDDPNAALEAGADLAGGEELVHRIASERAKCLRGFSACIAQPHLVPLIASKAGKLLGPKRMMPSPKDGTVVQDVEECVRWMKNNWTPFRTDRAGNIHLAVGKLSYDDEMLIENVKAAIRKLLDVRPATVKKKYVRKAVICSTMGPGVQLDVDQLVRSVTAAG